MAGVSVTIDTSSVERMLSSAITAISPPTLTYALRDAAKVYYRGIQTRAPRRSGRLANSFDVVNTSLTSYEVGSDLVYAPVQEYGATIRARRAQVLRFAIGNQVFYRRSVTIPARPYVGPAFTAETDKAIGAFGDRIDRALQ